VRRAPTQRFLPRGLGLEPDRDLDGPTGRDFAAGFPFGLAGGPFFAGPFPPAPPLPGAGPDPPPSPGGPPDYTQPLQLLARGIVFVDPVSGQPRRFESRRRLQFPDHPLNGRGPVG